MENNIHLNKKTKNQLMLISNSKFLYYYHQKHFVRVVKEADLRSAGQQSARVRTPQVLFLKIYFYKIKKYIILRIK